jgi:hypothetical protein
MFPPLRVKECIGSIFIDDHYGRSKEYANFLKSLA